MTTLARAGRIDTAVVDEEMARLNRRWGVLDGAANDHVVEALMGSTAQNLDPFDRIQLEGVIKVRRESRSRSAAGASCFPPAGFRMQPATMLTG